MTHEQEDPDYPMPRQVVDKMYWRGFCDDAIHQAARTDLAAERAVRLSWQEEHVPTCTDCQRAQRFLHLEHEVARRLGPRAQRDFDAGRDFSHLPDYDDQLHHVLDLAVQARFLQPGDLEWMTRMIERHGKPWPKGDEL